MNSQYIVICTCTNNGNIKYIVYGIYTKEVSVLSLSAFKMIINQVSNAYMVDVNTIKCFIMLSNDTWRLHESAYCEMSIQSEEINNIDTKEHVVKIRDICNNQNKFTKRVTIPIEQINIGNNCLYNVVELNIKVEGTGYDIVIKRIYGISADKGNHKTNEVKVNNSEYFNNKLRVLELKQKVMNVSTQNIKYIYDNDKVWLVDIEVSSDREIVIPDWINCIGANASLKMIKAIMKHETNIVITDEQAKSIEYNVNNIYYNNSKYKEIENLFKIRYS